MLKIASDVQPGAVTFYESAAQQARRERAEAKQKRLSSLATPKGVVVPIRQLPWPQFVEILKHRRELTRRAHIRWCMRTAIRNCETLKRAEGRSFELRPGGRHNIVANGGLYYEDYRDDYRGTPTRIGKGDDAKLMLQNGRYVHELEDNLRKLLCPPQAIPLIKRAIKAKLALNWDLEDWYLEDEAAVGQ
jgi:hypothetical protein